MKPRSVATTFGALLFAISVAVHPGHAENWHDPEPPLTWDATIGCELVVLARYDSHKDGELTLRVAEVLKGKLDTKQPLTVKLAHLYSVEMGPVGWDRMRKRVDHKTPKVCYKQQFMKPGALQPVAVRPDAREPAIYFFPRASEPVLKVRGQVQSPFFQKGWQQALDQRPMDLLFRLMQDVNRELSRDALEELGKSRDPAAIDQLITWTVKSAPDVPTAEYRSPTLLARLRDHKGDVYDRARKTLLAAVVDKEDYRPIRLGSLLAIVDPKRAAKDLPGILSADQPLIVRRAALHGLARIPERWACQLALDSLRDADLAESAVGSLHAQLEGEDYGDLPRYHRLDDEPWLVEQLQAALLDVRVAEKTKKLLRDYFWNHLRPRAPLDLELLRKSLMDPKDRTYHGWADGPTANLLRDAREACDPRLVPMLVEVLEKMPVASSNHGSAFQGTLAHYARICPRAMKKEFEKRGFPGKLPSPDPGSGVPLGIRDAMEATKIWPSRNKPYLENEIAHCFELAVEIRAGKSDQVDALLKAVDALHAKHENRGQAAFPALLDSGSPAARERFFDYLNKAKQGRLNHWSNQITLRDVAEVINPLHAKHPKLHLELTLGLLKSNSLVEREAGVICLGSGWQSGFGFDHEALEAERTRKLAEIEPFLHKLAAVSDIEARVLLLARAGYALEGEPKESWLPTLQSAAASNGEAARHAFRLLEVVMRESQCLEFRHFPRAQRIRALQVYLTDAGKVVAAPQK